MRQKILQELERIEREENVSIILASESGSRAWGFPSNDSDYDVRFIYVHQQEWYLSIDKKRDVIELPIDDLLDINGWDLRKSLQLMRKSNSPLLEWLSSPIQYRVRPQAFDYLLELSKPAFMPETSCHHYLSMAKTSISKYQDSDKVKLKVYMYAVRSILCCQWIIKNLTQPPMRITDLLAGVVDKPDFEEKITALIEQKKVHSEKYTVKKDDVIEKYVTTKMAELQDRIPKNPPKPSIADFNDLFIRILTEVKVPCRQ